MRQILFSWLVLSVLACNVSGVKLPEKWDRLTFRVVTDGSTGTGFLLRYGEDVFIVTNRHMVKPGETEFYVGIRKEVRSLDVNKKDSISSVDLKETIVPSKNMYFVSDEYDLAFVHITSFAGILDKTLIPESMIGDDSMVVAGREVFFLGYPGGLGGHTPNIPLVRGGIVAGESEHVIFLDGNIFGGSSGSPVFLDFDLENGVKQPYLIGIVSQFRTAPTPSHPAVKENMGIGLAVKIGYLRNKIENWLRDK